MSATQVNIAIKPYKSEMYPQPYIKSEPIEVEICDQHVETTSHKPRRCGRKRALDYLSLEERLLRKKLKNREAAQTSRDKKKARMDELEKAVAFLQLRNKELMTTIDTLKAEKQEVQVENDKLREELRCANAGSALECYLGSAVSNNPLPQGLHSGHLSLALRLITILTLQTIARFSVWMIGTGCFQDRSKITSTISTNLLMNSPVTHPIYLTSMKNRLGQWWGRHQHFWNPLHQKSISPILLLAS